MPQSRERVFIIGYNRDQCTKQILPITCTGKQGLKPKPLNKNQSQGQRVYDCRGLSVSLSSLGGGWGAKTGLYAFMDMVKDSGGMITNHARCLSSRYQKGMCNRDGETSGIAVFPVLTPERLNRRQNGRRIKNEDDPMFTLTVQDRHGIAIIKNKCGYNKGAKLKIASTVTPEPYNNSSIKIRKLTPLECFRLQGFPDSHYFNAKNIGMSDSQLYKQAGNAVTVNVVYAIAKKFPK